jgi:hypothetical protein
MLKLIDEFLTREPRFTEQLALRIGPPSPPDNRLLGVDPAKEDEWVHILARGGEVHASPEGPRFVPLPGAKGSVVIVRTSPDSVAGARLEFQ